MSFKDMMQARADDPVRNPPYLPSGLYECEVMGAPRIQEREEGGRGPIAKLIFPLKVASINGHDVTDEAAEQGYEAEELVEQWRGSFAINVWDEETANEEAAYRAFMDRELRRLKRIFNLKAQTEGEVFSQMVGEHCTVAIDLAEGRDGPVNYSADIRNVSAA